MEKNRVADKIRDFEELAAIVKRLKKQGKKVILSHGVFDLLHPGHIKHFEFAKKKADVLVVTITKDKYVNKGPGRPVFNHRLRAESIAALECVDYVAVNEWPTAVETITKLKPSLYIKGSEYRDRAGDLTGKIYDEEKAIESVGGDIVFSDEITFSSSQIINLYFSVYPKEADIFLKRFRSLYSSDSVIETIRGLKEMKVLVIGDAIVDEYHYCVGMGKPPKSDIISTKYINEERFAGGALAVAKHVSNFCKQVCLVSAIGTRNDYKDFITHSMGTNIKTKFFFRDDVPTVVKRRYLNPSFLTVNFEVSFIDDVPIPRNTAKKVCAYLDKFINDYDLVIAADFGHGFINQDIVKTLCTKAKFLAVNTQTNSANAGYNLITKYSRADYICIDEPEVRLAMHDKFSRLEDLMLKLKEKLRCGNIIITRGHLGAMVYEKSKGFSSIPVFSKEIVDRVGAGDAFLSLTAPVVSKGFPLELVGFIGNVAGALAVLIVGNRKSIEPVPLYKFITTLLK